MANNTHGEKKAENEANIAAVRAFRANHPHSEFVEPEYVRKARVNKALVKKTDKKYREIARKQKQMRDLEKAILRYEEQQKTKKFNARLQKDHGR
jgi:hypothetical protein